MLSTTDSYLIRGGLNNDDRILLHEQILNNFFFLKKNMTYNLGFIQAHPKPFYFRKEKKWNRNHYFFFCLVDFNIPEWNNSSIEGIFVHMANKE